MLFTFKNSDNSTNLIHLCHKYKCREYLQFVAYYFYKICYIPNSSNSSQHYQTLKQYAWRVISHCAMRSTTLFIVNFNFPLSCHQLIICQIDTLQGMYMTTVMELYCYTCRYSTCWNNILMRANSWKKCVQQSYLPKACAGATWWYINITTGSKIAESWCQYFVRPWQQKLQLIWQDIFIRMQPMPWWMGFVQIFRKVPEDVQWSTLAVSKFYVKKKQY